MSVKDELGRLRASIDEADRALFDAMDQRAKLVRTIRSMLDTEPELFVRWPQSEELIRAATEHLTAFPTDHVPSVLREIWGAYESLLADRQVLYLGPEGNFTHEAARRYFGSAARLRALDSVSAVFAELERSKSDFGVLPFETSSEGATTATLQALVASEITICGELTLPVTFELASASGDATTIEAVYGAGHALAACERFLRSHFPKAMLLDVPSGEVGAQFALQDPVASVVATSTLRELHDLKTVHDRIEDATGVDARFAVVGAKLPARTGLDRTVLGMALQDQPGALYHALKPFADRQINLTRLETRPAHQAPWRYVVYVELDGHVTDRPLINALEELRGLTRLLKVLGSYPRPE